MDHGITGKHGWNGTCIKRVYEWLSPGSNGPDWSGNFIDLDKTLDEATRDLMHLKSLLWCCFEWP